MENKITLDIEQQRIFFISDTHLSHTNIIKYDQRPFNSTKEHDDYLIDQWNKTVMPDDIIFHLGDFGFGTAAELEKFLKILNGKIYLIMGNHDERNIKRTYLKKYFVDIFEYLKLTIKDKDNYQSIILFHYPIQEWDGYYRGAIHLHGHTHGHIPNINNRRDMAVNVNNYRPVSYQEILESIKNGKS